MRRTLDNVPKEIELVIDDGDEVIGTMYLSLAVRRVILQKAIQEHQSIQVAQERFVLGALRHYIVQAAKENA